MPGSVIATIYSYIYIYIYMNIDVCALVIQLFYGSFGKKTSLTLGLGYLSKIILNGSNRRNANQTKRSSHV